MALGGLLMVPVVLVAAVLLVRATQLGPDRSEESLVLPSVGRRVAPAGRPSCGSGSDA